MNRRGVVDGGKDQSDDEQERLREFLRRRRRRLDWERIAGLACGAVVAAILTFAGLKHFFPFSAGQPVRQVDGGLIVFVTITITGAAALLAYLRGSISTGSVSGDLAVRVLELENELGVQSLRIDTKIKGRYVDDSVRAEIISELKQELSTSAASSVLGEIEQRVRSNTEVTSQGRAANAPLDESTTRLSSAIAALHLRANVNLVFGIVMSVAGIAILGYTLASPIQSETPWDFVRNYVPRFTLVVVIELFAYFFLNLYKANLAETRYYHNEITNLAARRTSVLTAFSRNDESLLNSVVLDLLSTERNRILSKGQTTVELAKAKNDTDAAKALTETLVSILEAIVAGRKKEIGA